MENKQKFELDDESLDTVVGGLEVHAVGVGTITTCDQFVCVWCGHKKANSGETEHICKPQGGAVFENVCNECEFLYSCNWAYKNAATGVPSSR